ncbi:MAG: methyltransferase domain-containing protein, partial [Bacteroidota bacterium]
MSSAENRAKMPKGSAPILDNRRIETDYRTIVPYLAPGMRVLDVGCGTGAMSSGFAERVGPSGSVTGIDSSEHLIAAGQQTWSHISNLQLQHIDLFAFETEEPFDLIVSARVLQWLRNPKEALAHLYTLLKPGGTLSILDYDHTSLMWEPEPPASMRSFYNAFLQWRKEAGMNNQIARDLPAYFADLGLGEIESFVSDEHYQRGADNFEHKIRIWKAVAESRGKRSASVQYPSLTICLP